MYSLCLISSRKDNWLHVSSIPTFSTNVLISSVMVTRLILVQKNPSSNLGRSAKNLLQLYLLIIKINISLQNINEGLEEWFTHLIAIQAQTRKSRNYLLTIKLIQSMLVRIQHPSLYCE